MRASAITIHFEQQLASEIGIKSILDFARCTFPVPAESKPYIFEGKATSNTRIYDLKRRLHDGRKNVPSVRDTTCIPRDAPIPHTAEDGLQPTYDGFELQSTAAEQIHSDGCLGALDVVLTELLTCTFDENDCRYHARAIIGSNPSLISISGIVESAARPKEYYFERLTCIGQEELAELDKKYCKAFIVRHDPRLPDIVKGYLLQAVMYYETGEAFCTDAQCRLYNAHWQSDLIRTQILERRLCKRHRAKLSQIQSSRGRGVV